MDENNNLCSLANNYMNESRNPILPIDLSFFACCGPRQHTGQYRSAKISTAVRTLVVVQLPLLYLPNDSRACLVAYERNTR